MDLLAPPRRRWTPRPTARDSPDRYQRTREKMRAMLAAGELDQRQVEIAVEHRATPMMFTGMGMEQMDFDLQGMFEKIMPQAATSAAR